MNWRETTPADLEGFVSAVENKTRLADAQVLLEMFEKVTGEKPHYWPPSIIGFGAYHYVYESGREGDSILVGFSPRKANLVIYCMGSVAADDPLIAKLGKHRASKACLYINKLADIDMSVLEKIIKKSYDRTLEKWGRIEI